MSVQLSTAIPNEKFKWVSSSVVLWKIQGVQDQRGSGTRNPLRWPLCRTGVTKILENYFSQISKEAAVTLGNVFSWRNIVFLEHTNLPLFMPSAYHHQPCNSLAASLSWGQNKTCNPTGAQITRKPNLNPIHLSKRICMREVTTYLCYTSFSCRKKDLISPCKEEADLFSLLL